MRAGSAILLLLLGAACYTDRTRFADDYRCTPAVVSEHPLATAVGLKVLEQGGNAADAAVATALALAVVYPQAGNLGGGGFAVWVSAGGEELALDFREEAPSTADAALYLDPEGELVPARSVRGPLAVGVPGSPLGLYLLHRECGSGLFAWADLVRPAIGLAQKGFDVDPWLARDLRQQSAREKMNPAALERFYPLGNALVPGQRLVQKDLARTLALLAQHGPAGFYSGEIAAALVCELEDTPIPGGSPSGRGVLTADDLVAYRVHWRKPLVGIFEGHELVCMPPPSSGGLVVLQVLAVLEGMPLGADHRAALSAGRSAGLSEQMVHWWIEALRLAFADRAEHMGDPAFHPVPVAELLSPEWIARRRVSIGERAASEVRPWAAPPPPESSETTHLSVIDREGNAVSLTTTLNGAFGSGILVRGAGFFLNNELDDFSIQAGEPNQFGLVGSQANSIQPGKRPLSSMSPTVVRDLNGRVMLVVGSPGGPRIITSVLQTILRVLVLEQDLDAAVSAPRLHQQWRPRETLFEASQGGGWPEELLAALKEERGQPIEVVERRFGSVQAIYIPANGASRAVSDPRRGGAAGVLGQGVGAAAVPPPE